MSRNPAGGPGVGPSRTGEQSDSRGSDRPHIVDLDFLRQLIAAVNDSGIDSVEISRGGTRIRVAKTPTGAPAASQHPAQPGPPPPAPAAAALEAPKPPPAASNLVDITSPMVGTFYGAPAPEAPSYVEVGSRVVKGQTLCILEAMKLMNELEAEVEGVIREICVESSEPVEYGQVLFRIEPGA